VVEWGFNWDILLEWSFQVNVWEMSCSNRKDHWSTNLHSHKVRYQSQIQVSTCSKPYQILVYSMYRHMLGLINSTDINFNQVPLQSVPFHSSVTLQCVLSSKLKGNELILSMSRHKSSISRFNSKQIQLHYSVQSWRPGCFRRGNLYLCGEHSLLYSFCFRGQQWADAVSHLKWQSWQNKSNGSL